MAAEEIQNCTVDEAIIYVSRGSLRPLFRKTLKEVGIGSIATPESLEACVVELVKSEKGLLVIDWTGDTEETAKILSAAQGKYSADTRPILFVSSDIPPDLLGLAAEYNVTRVHSGEISAKSIESHITQILSDELNVASFRQQVVHIADSQAVGDWSGANDQIRDLLEDHEDDAGLLGELVNNLIHQEKWDEALEFATQLRTLHPGNVRGMHLYGRCKMKKGGYREACAVLKAANIINPFNTNRLVDLGNALLNCDQIEEADENFSRALEIDENHAGAREGAGKCHLIAGEVNEALELLADFSSPRELASVFNDSAIISIRQGRFKDGLTLYKAGIKSLGKNNRIIAKLLFNMGVAYHKKSDIDHAYDMFKLSVEKDSGFDPALHNMHVCAKKVGRLEEFKRIAVAIRSGEKIEPVDDEGIVDEFDDAFEDEGFS